MACSRQIYYYYYWFTINYEAIFLFYRYH